MMCSVFVWYLQLKNIYISYQSRLELQSFNTRAVACKPRALNYHRSTAWMQWQALLITFMITNCCCTMVAVVVGIAHPISSYMRWGLLLRILPHITDPGVVLQVRLRSTHDMHHTEKHTHVLYLGIHVLFWVLLLLCYIWYYCCQFFITNASAVRFQTGSCSTTCDTVL